MSTERRWTVKYKLPDDQVRTPREIVVVAASQADARRVAEAMLPGAIIVGGAQPA